MGDRKNIIKSLQDNHTLYKDIKCLGALFRPDKAEFGMIYL